MPGQAKLSRAPELVMWGFLIGFLLGYATDLSQKACFSHCW